MLGILPNGVKVLVCKYQDPKTFPEILTLPGTIIVRAGSRAYNYYAKILA